LWSITDTLTDTFTAPRRATTVAELGELAGLIEQDPDLNVVVFDSVNPPGRGGASLGGQQSEAVERQPVRIPSRLSAP